jgi:hypothetical protein
LKSPSLNYSPDSCFPFWPRPFGMEIINDVLTIASLLLLLSSSMRLERG